MAKERKGSLKSFLKGVKVLKEEVLDSSAKEIGITGNAIIKVKKKYYCEGGVDKKSPFYKKIKKLEKGQDFPMLWYGKFYIIGNETEYF